MERDYNQRRSRTWSNSTGSLFGLLITFALLQLTSSLSPESYRSPQQTNDESIPQRPKFSSKIPAQISRRKQHTSSSSLEPEADFSAGFPSGFTQGLPTFDFSGPMGAEESNDKREPTSADTENVGFVHGPPEGFPTLEQLGGQFNGFSSMAHHSPSGAHSQAHLNGGPPQHRQQFPQQAESSPFHVQQNEPGPEDYLAGPGPSSIHNQVEVHRPGGPGGPTHLRRPHPPNNRHQSFSRPEVGGSGTSRNPQYLPTHGYPPNYSTVKRPVILKVSGKKVQPTKLPPGPPVFFAPSPDIQPASSQKQDYQHKPPHMQRPSTSASNQNAHPFRQKRSENGIAKPEDKPSDQVADGSAPETFWEVSSPFILFDTYKGPENTNTNNQQVNAGEQNLTQDHDSGEQRFFPSYPASPNPYLGLPFGGPPSRAPLFPGPSANRAPSRYHPQFGPTKYNVQAAPPNRGPSGVYSAESHDHDSYQDNNLLGSGNFEVIRGGTYYEDDDAYHSGFHGGSNDNHGGGGQDDGDYYHHNGHSSPSGYRAPGTDFFANFRDFADINPPSRSYSHRHETLAHPPASSASSAAAKQRQPKNILEKLESSLDSLPAHHKSLSRESDPMMATF